MVLTAELHELVNYYIKHWRPKILKKDSEEHCLFLSYAGKALTSNDLENLVAKYWPDGIDKKFGFTELRKTAHTMYEEFLHEFVQSKKELDELVSMGAGHK